jgi:glutathione S-transferase
MPKDMSRTIDVATSLVASTLTGWRGTNVIVAAEQPMPPLRLYDMEGCPYCRAVREALTALGLDAIILPSPKGGKRFRPEAKKLSGKTQFPLLVDEGRSVVMGESAAIVDYLFQTYGKRPTPWLNRVAGWAPAVSATGSAVRQGRGLKARPAKAPEQMLELWSFESSPFSRIVRERLTELELPYVLHNLGKEQLEDMGLPIMRKMIGRYKAKPGGKREQLLEKKGRVQVPYFEDPNTGVSMFESAKIVEYLETQYAL